MMSRLEAFVKWRCRVRKGICSAGPLRPTAGQAAHLGSHALALRRQNLYPYLYPCPDWYRSVLPPVASISLKARPSRRSDGKLPLYLRLHAGGKTRYYSLGVRVAPSRWSEKKKRVKREHPNAPRLNRLCSNARQEAEAVLSEMQIEGAPVTAASLKERVAARLAPEEADQEPEDCFILYCEQLLSTWRGRWAYQTMQAYQTAVRKLKKWHGDSDGYVPLPFEEVTPSMCRAFQEHLATDRGNSVNTQHKNLSTLKGFYKQAMEDDVIEWGRNPFDALTLRKVAGEKEKLTTDELRKLKEVELPTELYRDVRRWFFFAFYAGGMRFSDVAELERRHIREEGEEIRVYYRMGKTKDLHGALLVPEAVEILAHYGWQEKEASERVMPILDGRDTSTPKKRRQAIASRNALVNKYLKKMAARAGIEKSVSFHLSRHSTAGYLLEQGYGVRTIQRVLGHTTSRQTEIYLKGFQSSGPDDASRSLSL